MSTILAQGARILIQMVSIVILARLLTPEDYGLIAMVTALIGIGEVFRDFGLSSAAIQARDVSAQQRSNLFWTNTAIGVALAILTVVLSGLVADLYGDDRLEAIAQLLALTFAFNGVSTQHRADLVRRLRLTLLAVIDTVAQLLALVIAIALALTGANYWSLVVMQVSMIVFSAIGVFGFARWLPERMRFRGHGMRSFFRFGGGVLGAQLLGYASKNTDSVVLGATLGPGPLGLYNRAFQLMTLPLNQLQAPSTRVALPVLSRLQDDHRRFNEYLLTGQMLLLHLTGLVLGASAAVATPLFVLVLGPDWEDASGLFQVLAVAGFATMASYACYWVFMSKGLTGSFLRLSLVTRPLLILAIVVGATGGVYGVAWAYSITSAILWPVPLWWLARVSNAPTRAMFTNGARILGLHGVAFASSSAIQFGLSGSSDFVLLVVGVGIYASVIVIAMATVSTFRRDLAKLANVRHLLGRG